MNRKKFLRAALLIPFVHVAVKTGATELGGATVERCKTGRDAEGPYYKSGAPLRNVIETDGVPLRIEGKILKGDDCKTPVPDAMVDVWHCNNHGDYDMQGFKGRGQVKTDQEGQYSFTTILPPPYGSRPRHIHFKIRAKGYNELTTQLYFEGDPNIQSDFARNAEKGRVVALKNENGIRKGTFILYL